MRTSTSFRRAASLLLAVAVGVLGTQAFAANEQPHLPADKTAVAGAAVTEIDPNSPVVLLQERMRVSTPSDLILGVTAECSILTSLVTDNETKSAKSEGKVEIWLTIDDKLVPIETAKPAVGEVVFCNREYSRTVADGEGGGLIDTESDYIRTRSANAFNWVALNVGTDFDKASNGDNVVDVVVHARYLRQYVDAACAPGTKTCSQAYVGSRTLVIEPVKAAVNEVSEPSDAGGDELLPPL